MSNTLTWDSKYIQLPKVNTNLISIVSLILLLTMVFLTISAIADNCDHLREAFRIAKSELAWATAEAVAAELLWVAAMGVTAWQPLNPAAWVALAGATAYKTFAIADVALKAEKVANAKDALDACENPSYASEGCISGGCNV